MSYTNYTSRSGGSNLNAGSRTGVGEEGTAAAFTYGSGSWNQSTWTFTVSSGNPLTDGVAVGDLVSVYDQANSMRLTPGNSSNGATAPDNAALSITGDIDIRVKFRSDLATPPTAATSLVNKKNTAGNQRSYQFHLNSSGNLSYTWSTNGTAVVTATSTTSLAAGVGYANYGVIWVRVTHDVDNGSSQNVVTFYTSVDGSTWVQLGTAVTTAGTTSIFDSTALLSVGSEDSGAFGGLLGDFYYAEVRNGIGGTVVASPDFSAQSAGTTSFSDAQGNTWTLGSNAAIVTPRMLSVLGRVSSRTSTTIVLTSGARIGYLPNLSGTATLKVGGAWEGQSAGVFFPAGLNWPGVRNSASNPSRLNAKNDRTYAFVPVTNYTVGGFSHTFGGTWQGYTTTFGDEGKATFTGTSASSATVLLSFATTSVSWLDIDANGNGSVGTNQGVLFGVSVCLIRCRFRNMRGSGVRVSGAELTECEADGNNLSNTASFAGIEDAGGRLRLVRCRIHDNTGSNTTGVFKGNNESLILEECQIWNNGSHGVQNAGNALIMVRKSEFWQNAGCGLAHTGTGSPHWLKVESSNFLKNGQWGVRNFNTSSATFAYAELRNCGFGSVSQANASGTSSFAAADGGPLEVGSVTYAADVTPWVDPANGDFRISLAAAKGTGRGAFPGSGGTVGYPDIGAAQGSSLKMGRGRLVNAGGG